ncbi:MAG TPA: hypothetical protein DIT65_02650 [Cryomorphaceae bacterium]|nr:hypothetical protein [Cryomorphaceae bacterium]|tara:strand:+ start:3013 stop:3711 length:699 start_codon:yes stop_codon:yes gene_type:complete
MGTDLTSVTDSARALYDLGRYGEALEKYRMVYASQAENDVLCYNMGNCYARMGELGEAKVFFERALIYAPNNIDAQHNLDWINLRLTDALVAPKEELVEWIGQWERSIMSPEGWTFLAWVFLTATMALLVLRRTKNRSLNWRWPFTTTALALLLLGMSYLSIPKIKTGVVVERNSYGYSEPSSNSKRLILLSEGSAGTILGTNNSWVYVELGDGRLAWFDVDEWESLLPAPD